MAVVCVRPSFMHFKVLLAVVAKSVSFWEIIKLPEDAPFVMEQVGNRSLPLCVHCSGAQGLCPTMALLPGQNHYTVLIANLLPLLFSILPLHPEICGGRAHQFIWGCFLLPCTLPLELQSPVFLVISPLASALISTEVSSSASSNCQSRAVWTASSPCCPDSALHGCSQTTTLLLLLRAGCSKHSQLTRSSSARSEPLVLE